jgi:hypothetical protein
VDDFVPGSGLGEGLLRGTAERLFRSAGNDPLCCHWTECGFYAFGIETTEEHRLGGRRKCCSSGPASCRIGPEWLHELGSTPHLDREEDCQTCPK